MLFLKTFKDAKFVVDGNAFQTFITLSTKNFCLMLAMYYPYVHTNIQRQWSGCSKVRVETVGQTDGRTRPNSLPFSLTQVIYRLLRHDSLFVRLPSAQSCPWVHFLWTNKTQSTTSEKFGPNPTEPNTNRRWLTLSLYYSFWPVSGTCQIGHEI